MRAVVQRVQSASVVVEDEVVGAIDHGLLVFLGVGPGDDDSAAVRLAARIRGLRIFPDGDGRMNRDITQAGGAVLVVSQFTLYGDVSRGHRPSFIGAGPPDHAQRLVDVAAEALRTHGLTVATGRFGAHMDVSAVNDGPVTLVLSSGEGPWAADAG